MAQVRKDIIGDRSTDIDKMLPYWDLVDAISGGIDTMIEAGDTYLPRFPQETADDYQFRLSQAKMTNVFSDIIESLASKPYEKPVRLIDGVEYSEFITNFVKDVDGAGNNISVFSSDVFEAGIKSALDWIFVDNPKTTTGKMTIAQKKASNIRPFWSRIAARNVLEIRNMMVGGDERMTYFRYLEPGDPDRVRILELMVGHVTYELYEKGEYSEERQSEYALIDSGVLDIDEIPIVPFTTGRRIARSYQFHPPMKAAADAQKDLYHQESALKYAKILAAFPMLSGNGVRPDKDEAGNIKPIGVGPNKVLYAPAGADGTVGNWKYVEPNANTLEFLAKDIGTATRELRELGRQPLTAHTQNLTTVTTAFAAGKSKSSVASWAMRLADALDNALRITSKWEGDNEQPKVFVYTDFDEFTDSEDIEALNAARDRGDISQETYWEEYKRRDILSDDFNSEKERDRMSNEGPGQPSDDG